MLDFKKARRKPLELEVCKLSEELHREILEGAQEYTNDAKVSIKVGNYNLVACCQGSDSCFYVQTLEDVAPEILHRAEIGDFLIKGVQGEIWAVKPEIFYESYEVLD